VYGCNYEPSSQMAEALYFAPHLGQKIATLTPGIRPGIGYIAKIEQIEIVETWDDLNGAVREAQKSGWRCNPKRELESLKSAPSWEWHEGSHKYSFLFLSEPLLVFNPPINKERLQKGKGWLSKRVFTFEEFYRAWSGEAIWES